MRELDWYAQRVRCVSSHEAGKSEPANASGYQKVFRGMHDPMLVQLGTDFFLWSVIEFMSTIVNFEARVGNTALIIALARLGDAYQNCFTMRTTGSIRPFASGISKLSRWE